MCCVPGGAWRVTKAGEEGAGCRVAEQEKSGCKEA